MQEVFEEDLLGIQVFGGFEENLRSLFGGFRSGSRWLGGASCAPFALSRTVCFCFVVL
jgi:hypothetical protein